VISVEDMLIGSTIHRVAQLVQQRIDEEIADSGLTRLSWIAAGHVGETQGMSITDLASRLELANATTGQLVDRMVANGWVERTPSLTDRRSQVITTTKKAQDALRGLAPRRYRLQRSILQDLTHDERNLLFSLLERIRLRLSNRRHDR
jgi:DNA-binding MarR family transcriptional regulator